MEHIEIIANEIQESVSELANNQIAASKAADRALAAAMQVVLTEYVETVGTEPSHSFIKGMEAFAAQALAPRMAALAEKAGPDAVAKTSSAVWEQAGASLAASMLLPAMRVKLAQAVRERDRRIEAQDARVSAVKAIDAIQFNAPTPAPASYDPVVHVDGGIRALARIDELAKKYPAKKARK